MPELHTDDRTRQQPAYGGTGWHEGTGLLPLPAKTLARRKRLMRYGGLLAFVLSLGLSAIPGPKGSSNTISIRTEHGIKTQIHEFYFSRHFGRPFTTGRLDYNDDGSIKNIRFEGDGVLGNFVVALAIVIGASIFIGRRRPDD